MSRMCLPRGAPSRQCQSAPCAQIIYTIKEMPFCGLRWNTGGLNRIVSIADSFKSSYVLINRPVKLKKACRVFTRIWPTPAHCYCQNKGRTRQISYWLLAKTSLDLT